MNLQEEMEVRRRDFNLGCLSRLSSSVVCLFINTPQKSLRILHDDEKCDHQYVNMNA